MIHLVDECHLFGILRTALRRDLTISHGIPNSIAGQILNWFDPANPRYLEHVDHWQRLLCSVVETIDDEDSPPFIPTNVFGHRDITRIPWHWVDAIHQIAKLFYKWHGVPRKETDWNKTKDRLANALPIRLDAYEVKQIQGYLSKVTLPNLEHLVGRFGPGSTCEGFTAYEKWTRSGYIPDVPASLYRVNSRDPWTPKGYNPLRYTKIAEVPKSIKANRIVSSEPAMSMYAQLAVADELVAQLHNFYPAHVSLNDAEKHNLLLLRDKACSIDLSDASDHVSCELVQLLLPQLWPVLAKVRSTHSLFPDGELVSLDTFAPMGSGVCFPVLTLIVLGIIHYASSSVSGPSWFGVYGDDVIVHQTAYDFAIDLLERAGLVVNRGKSACTGIYRESCGREMLYNEVITPVYIRDPLDQVDASKVEQIVSGLQRRFFLETARVIAEESQCLRFTTWNRDLQRLEVCVRTTSCRQKIRTLDGWDGLNRWFCVGSQQEVRWMKNILKAAPTGVSAEVWTKRAWRLKSAQDYSVLLGLLNYNP